MQTTHKLVRDTSKTVDQMLQALCTAWNLHGRQALSALFWANADFVNVLGMHFRGRDEIDAVHRELHRSVLRAPT